MTLTKFFFDRPSAEGFKKGLGLKLVRPIEHKPYTVDADTAFQVPGFGVSNTFVVGPTARPFYFAP